MPLISNIGRKSWKSRLLTAFIYIILSVLGTTMVVPFLITVSGSASNAFDYERFWPLPRYLWSSEDRFMKCLVPYFNIYKDWTRQMNTYIPEIPGFWSNWSVIGRDIPNIDRLASGYISADAAQQEKWRIAAADYAEFAESYPLSDCLVYTSQIDTIDFLMKKYEKQLYDRNPARFNAMSRSKRRAAALNLLNESLGVPFENFYNITFNSEMNFPLGFQGWFPPYDSRKYDDFNSLKEAYRQHVFTPGIKNKWIAFLKTEKYSSDSGDELFPVSESSNAELKNLWLKFKMETAPASPAVPFALRAVWYDYLRSEEVGIRLNIPGGREFDIETYNSLAGTKYGKLEETPFPIPAKFKPEIQDLWKDFVVNRYPLRLTSVNPSKELNLDFRKFVSESIKNINIANSLLGTKYTSWEQFNLTRIPPPGENENECNRRDLWKNFVKTLPIEKRILSSSEIAWQKHLRKKYGNLLKVNQAYGTNFKHIEESFPPFMAAYAVTFKNNEYSMAFGPVFDNYRVILDFLLFNGNAIMVTLLLITMTITCTLTVNPLAAYALSRFNLRGQDKIMIFLLATMAFPSMVSAIPAYLLMRDLGLLNTFFALVLPGAANGMAIFILKGFFDSLPIELFEASSIDGATEFQIFRIVAMPLVKPILAINSLMAFIGAYNGWEWALIICQDKSMWTIAVWLFQASAWWAASPWIVSAGFIVASIPTLIVFVSCQKIILRGIIIPSMK
jgi:ABC-type glycerol-3-phosphate transport system permease component